MKRNKFTLAALALLALLTFACKKKDENPDMKSGGCSGISGGINGTIIKNVTFYITKDFGCGNLKIAGIVNKSNNNDNYTTLNNKREIDRVYTSGKPACQGEGTVTVAIDKGYTYEYRFTCGSQTFKGEFFTDCEGDCMAVEVK